METTQWMQNIINSKPVGSTHIEFGGKMLYWCFSGVNSGRCFRNGSWCSGKVTEHLSSLEDMQNQIDLINQAFKKSKGRFICLLDADDYFNINKLTILKNHFLKKKNINTIFDLPIKKYNSQKIKFSNKKKIQKNIWPSIIPTSSISCKRVFFKKFMKKCFLKKYENLEIDFRLNVYSRNLDKNFFICKDDITYYRQVNDGIMSNIKKFSKKWWVKRLAAHNFMEKLFSNYNLKYNNKLDFLISKVLGY